MFSKQFPKKKTGSTYPEWVEVYLDEFEEEQLAIQTREENIILMKECVRDAMKIIDSEKLNRYQSDMIKMAVALFEKRASHLVHYKENKAKEKFDLNFK